MIKKLLDVDGPLIGFLEKTWELIALSVLWLLGCLPVVTFCSSCAALYHGVTRSVRGGQGSAVREFLNCFRAGLPVGAGLSLILVGALAVLEGVSVYLLGSVIPSGVVCVLMILDVFVLIYAGPVRERFSLGVVETLKLSFVLSLQYAHYTFGILLGTLALAALQVFVLPMATILFLPGAWCLATSFLMEKALSRYTPGNG